MRKRIVTTSAVIAGLLLVGGGTALAVTNSDITAPSVSEKSDKTVSVPVVEHATDEAKASSATPSPSASEKAAAEAKAVETVTNATSGSSSAPAPAAPVADAAQNGGEYYGTPVEFNPNAPRYDLQHGGNPYATYDQSQSDATATYGLTDASANAGMTTTNPSQITVTYPGQ